MIDVLTDDSAQGRTRLYMTMLYSERLVRAAQAALAGEIELPEANRELLRSMDFQRLQVEQRGRVQDMCTYFESRSLGLAGVLGDELQPLVTGYCESDAFGAYRGRSLLEDFCLWAHPVLRERDDVFAAEVARLYGVVDGLAHDVERASPWPRHLGRAGDPWEAFLGSRRLFDEAGRPASADNQAQLRILPPQLVKVRIDRNPDSTVTFGATPIDHQELPR